MNGCFRTIIIVTIYFIVVCRPHAFVRVFVCLDNEIYTLCIEQIFKTAKKKKKKKKRRKLHYENTPIQTYRKFYLKKRTENFQIKNSDIFYISAQNIDCWYSLEPPRQFYNIEVGFKEVKII